MARRTEAAALRPVNPATLEPVGAAPWFPYDEGALDGFRGMVGLLYGGGLSRKLGAAWRHRRGLLALGRRYLSGL
jgi:hypothetical protein